MTEGDDGDDGDRGGGKEEGAGRESPAAVKVSALALAPFLSIVGHPERRSW